MTNEQRRVGGVDSHKDSIHVAVITGLGQPVGDREFPTTAAGCRRAVAWLIEHGPLAAVGMALSVTRRSAVKAQQAARRQIGALLVNAPSQLRDRYRDPSSLPH